MMSFRAFSQTDTLSSACVVLNIPTARSVVAELIEKDMLTEQLKISRDSIGIFKEITKEQDSTIIVYKQQNYLCSLEIQNRDNQIQEYKLTEERLKQQLRSNRTWTIGIGCTAAALLTLLLLGGK